MFVWLFVSDFTFFFNWTDITLFMGLSTPNINQRWDSTSSLRRHYFDNTHRNDKQEERYFFCANSNEILFFWRAFWTLQSRGKVDASCFWFCFCKICKLYVVFFWWLLFDMEFCSSAATTCTDLKHFITAGLVTVQVSSEANRLKLLLPVNCCEGVYSTHTG